MANNLKLGKAAANVAADALCALLNGGVLRLYTGIQPVTADTALADNTLLAELVFGSPAFDVATEGVATAHAITKDGDAAATGTATWFRAVQSDGITTVFDGSVGVSGSDVNMPTTSIVQHAEIVVTAMTFTTHKG